MTEHFYYCITLHIPFLSNREHGNCQYPLCLPMKQWPGWLVLFRGYHTAVFVLFRISSLSVDNCPRLAEANLYRTIKLFTNESVTLSTIYRAHVRQFYDKY